MLRLERSPASQKLLANIQKKYTATGFTKAQAEKLGPRLVPLLSQAGLRLASSQNLLKKQPSWQEGKHPLPVKPSGGSESDFGTGDPNADSFLRAAGQVSVTKAKGSPETEGFFDDIGSFLTKGLSVAKPVLLTSARAGLQTLDQILAKKQSGTEALLDDAEAAGSDEKAASLLAHRAVVAECALQAVLEADKKSLTESVILGGAEGAEQESFFSGLLKAVQTIGPAVLKVAAPVLKTAVPILLNAVTGGGGQARALAVTNGVNGVHEVSDDDAVVASAPVHFMAVMDVVETQGEGEKEVEHEHEGDKNCEACEEEKKESGKKDGAKAHDGGGIDRDWIPEWDVPSS